MAIDPGIVELIEEYWTKKAETDRNILRDQRAIHRQELKIDELNNQRDNVRVHIETVQPLQIIPGFDATGERQIEVGSRVEITNRLKYYKGPVCRSLDMSNKAKAHHFGTVDLIVLEKIRGITIKRVNLTTDFGVSTFHSSRYLQFHDV